MGHLNSRYRSVAPAALEKRQAPRHAVKLERMQVDRSSGPQSIEARLIDLSIFGCRLAAEAIFREGEKLSLRFQNGGTMEAEIVWCKDGEMGCRFDGNLAKTIFCELART